MMTQLTNKLNRHYCKQIISSKNNIYASLADIKSQHFYKQNINLIIKTKKSKSSNNNNNRRIKMLSKYKIEYNKEVKEGLKQSKPIVALESCLICHISPYPKNLEIAKSLEAIIREEGAIPATIAVIKGVPKVGLEEDELESLAKSGSNVKKCSIRDFPLLISKGMDGGTTVAGTLAIAYKAGLKIFVTGGIGGVHRGGQDTLDISADLIALRERPMITVCAGIKSVLDIPRTLEYLETQGVCVTGYETDIFPAFFCRDSGCKVPRVDSPDEVAKMLKAILDIDLNTGIVLGVPIPEDGMAEGKKVQEATNQALRECEEKSITGSQITPFLLTRIIELTKGESLSLNISLLKNNARIGARVSIAFNKSKS